MKQWNYDKFRILFVGMVTIAFVLALIGIVDIPLTPFSGYRLSPDYKVNQVEPNSPASVAGMKPGDTLIEIGGIPTENLHQLSQQPRPKIEEEIRITALRERMRKEFILKQEALPGKDLFLAWAGNLMGFVMLAIGLAVYWRWPTKATTLFFLCNFCFALSFMTPPYFQSFFWRNMVAVNLIFLLTLGFAFFLHLTVVFPRVKPLVADTGFVESLIYLPAPLMAISYLALRLFQPRADLLVNLVLHDIFVLLVSVCLMLALAAVIHTFWTAPSLEKTQLLAVLLGSLLGVIPSAVGFIMETFVPQIILPGGDYYRLLNLLVPLSFGWALWQYKRRPEFTTLRHAA